MSKSSVIKNLKAVLTSPRYVSITAITSVFFFTLLVILQNVSTIRSFSQSQGFLAAVTLTLTLTKGFHETVTPLHYTTLLILSLLVGCVLALALYRRSVHQIGSKNTSLLSTLGASLGIIAPGCAACSIGVLPLVGLTTGSFFALLPFEGLEFSFLSIILLGFSVWRLASFDESCPVPRKR